jgi:hypothetical protein
MLEDDEANGRMVWKPADSGPAMSGRPARVAFMTREPIQRRGKK